MTNVLAAEDTANHHPNREDSPTTAPPRARTHLRAETVLAAVDPADRPPRARTRPRAGNVLAAEDTVDHPNREDNPTTTHPAPGHACALTTSSRQRTPPTATPITRTSPSPPTPRQDTPAR
ncbi:hypothetical protein GC175_14085 [bacterium]|nr:hypothetical protein [bacterium]